MVSLFGSTCVCEQLSSKTSVLKDHIEVDSTVKDLVTYNLCEFSQLSTSVVNNSEH